MNPLIKNILIPFLLIFLSVGTVKPKTKYLTGDLYFSDLRYGSFYNLPDTMVAKYKLILDTLKLTPSLNEGNKKFISQYETLKKENLLYHPFVDLKIKEKSFVRLYLDTSDYNQIKIHKRKALQSEHKKVLIKAEVKDLGYGLFYCISLKKVKKIKGQTLKYQHKFIIEDYN